MLEKCTQAQELGITEGSKNMYLNNDSAQCLINDSELSIIIDMKWPNLKILYLGNKNITQMIIRLRM